MAAQQDLGLVLWAYFSHFESLKKIAKDGRFAMNWLEMIGLFSPGIFLDSCEELQHHTAYGFWTVWPKK